MLPMDSLDLCLTCSSSRPPEKRSGGSQNSSQADHVTPCCSRRICSICLTRNPRLRAYNPCLACLGGVDSVSASRPDKSFRSLGPSGVVEVGGVEEDERFVVGEDESENEENNTRISHGSEEVDRKSLVSTTSGPSSFTPAQPTHTDKPPQYDEVKSLPSLEALNQSSPIANPHESLHSEESSLGPGSSAPPPTTGPSRYYIQPSDTLSGISLRFGINGRKLARLNKLPPSTLSTTPHLLHTRQYLDLPVSLLSSELPVLPPPPGEDERRARERAEKRFAFVTKELDYRIAKTYVALAEDDLCSGYELGMKKERSELIRGHGTSRSLESRAVDAYLDDVEWEEAERKASRGAAIREFPFYPRMNFKS